MTADKAVARIRSGMHVFVHGAAATPTPLLEALVRRRDLADVTLYHLHTGGPAPFVDPEQRGRFRSVSLFAGPPVRAADETAKCMGSLNQQSHARRRRRCSTRCRGASTAAIHTALPAPSLMAAAEINSVGS